MEVTVINAFVGKGLKGNPAGVACVDSFPEDDDMQRVAKEMELSETCFVCQGDNGSYNLRWFSPTAEVDLCGHATLAAAHYMWSEGVVSESEEINFYTRSGILKAKSEDGFIWLDFPAEVAHEVSDKELIETIAGALCIDLGQIKFVGQNRMDYLIEGKSVV